MPGWVPGGAPSRRHIGAVLKRGVKKKKKESELAGWGVNRIRRRRGGGSLSSD